MKFKELVLQNKYKTDKFSGHNYLDLYANLFDPVKKSVSNVLEVGVQKGHSLLLWRDFFINAQIMGADITDSKLDIDVKNEERIEYHVGNAYSQEFLNNVLTGKKFDIIIDDGSHLIQDMTWFVKHYPAFLNDGGILVVEDIAHFPHAEQLKKALPKEFQPKARVVDLRHIANRWDDVVLVVS